MAFKLYITSLSPCNIWSRSFFSWENMLKILITNFWVNIQDKYKYKEKEEKGAPFSPSIGNLRFNLSPTSFTHLMSICLYIYIHSTFGWMSQQLIEILLSPMSGLKKALLPFMYKYSPYASSLIILEGKWNNKDFERFGRVEL